MTPIDGVDPSPTAFRFGLGPAGLGGFGFGPGGLEGGGSAAKTWRDLAVHVEDLGYYALCFGEHIDGRPAPSHMALVVAEWTDRLRGAVHVHANDFHHPAVLARELNTVSMLTGGRFDAGIGAGWMSDDYRRLGLPFDPPRQRIDRLDEAVQILKATWSEDQVSRKGHHYAVDDVAGRGLLGGAPPPRLVMGGGGLRMLSLAARQADIVSVNVALSSGRLGPERGRSATIAATHQKLATVREAAGDRMGRLTLQVELHFVEIGPDRSAALERAAAALDLTVEEADASPHVLVGSVDEVCDRLRQRRETFGFSYICMSAAAVDLFAPVVARLAGT